MLRRRPFARFTLSRRLSSWGLLRRLELFGPGTRVHQGALHQVRISHPDARRRPALHIGLRSQGSSAALPDHALRGRPTACSPTASTPTSRTLVLRRSSATTATSWSTRMCAGAGCRRASSSTCGRIGRRRPARKRSMRARDTFDTIDWLIKQRAQPQRPGRDVGHLVSRLLHGRRHDRRPSRAQGGVAAGPGDRLVHRRRLASQRRLPAAARLQFPGLVRPSAPRADQEIARAVRRTARPTAMRSSCGWGRWPTPTPAISRTTCRSGTRSCSTGRTMNSGKPATSART